MKIDWNKLDDYIGENALPVIIGMAFVTVTITLFLMAGRH